MFEGGPIVLIAGGVLLLLALVSILTAILAAVYLGWWFAKNEREDIPDNIPGAIPVVAPRPEVGTEVVIERDPETGRPIETGIADDGETYHPGLQS